MQSERIATGQVLKATERVTVDRCAAPRREQLTDRYPVELTDVDERGLGAPGNLASRPAGCCFIRGALRQDWSRGRLGYRSPL